MADVITRFPTGRLRLSRIVYFTDLQHADSREIPIGVVAEATLTSLRAIGTALRPSFNDDELKMMGPMVRDILARPIATLWPEMVEAFTSAAPGGALELFASHHTSSLSVLSPADLDVPRQWLLKRDPDVLRTLVRDRLKVTLVDEYFRYLFPPRDDDVTDPTVEEEMQDAA